MGYSQGGGNVYPGGGGGGGGGGSTTIVDGVHVDVTDPAAPIVRTYIGENEYEIPGFPAVDVNPGAGAPTGTTAGIPTDVGFGTYQMAANSELTDIAVSLSTISDQVGVGMSVYLGHGTGGLLLGTSPQSHTIVTGASQLYGYTFPNIEVTAGSTITFALNNTSAAVEFDRTDVPGDSPSPSFGSSAAGSGVFGTADAVKGQIVVSSPAERVTLFTYAAGDGDTVYIRDIAGIPTIVTLDPLWSLVDDVMDDCPPYGTVSVSDSLTAAPPSFAMPGRLVATGSTITVSPATVGDTLATPIQFHGLNAGDTVDAELRVTRLGSGGEFRINGNGVFANTSGAGDYEIEVEFAHGAAYRTALHPTSTLGSEAVVFLASNPVTEYARGPEGAIITLPFVGAWNQNNNQNPSGLGMDAANVVTFQSRGNSGTSSGIALVLRDVPELAAGDLCSRTEALSDMIGANTVYSADSGSLYLLSSHNPVAPIDLAVTTISTGHDLTALPGQTLKFWVSDAGEDRRQWSAIEIDVDTMLAADAAGLGNEAFAHVFDNSYVTLNVIDAAAGDIEFIDNNRNVRYLRSELWVAGQLGDYSTTEQITGRKWIDGEPTYRVVLDISASSDGAVLMPAGSVDVIINESGRATSGGTTFPTPFLNGATNSICRVNGQADGSVVLQRGVSFATPQPGDFVTLEFTKP